MPIKIGFTVVYCTGEDERYRATDLNYHGPTVKGWRSAQLCTYPQEVTLQLHSTAILHKIQILAHQYLIPKKIEIWTLEDLDYDPALSPQEAQLFKYLGFITLSDNQATGFKSRELKSVTTPRTLARYVRLRLHENHNNDKNLYNQVGLVAVSVLGEPMPQDDFYGEEVNNNGQFDSFLSVDATMISNPQYTSPYDDLAFEMYVDSDVARIMRLMEAKKHQAVIEERFEYASKLKMAMEQLKEAGETLGRWGQEKKQAINLEDYDKAKAKKLQIDRYRDQVYSSLNVEHLLELEGHSEENDRSIGQSKYNNNFIIEQEPGVPGLEDTLPLNDELTLPRTTPKRIENIATRSPRHSEYVQPESQNLPRYLPPQSPQFSEPAFTNSPSRQRRTSFSEVGYSSSPRHISHSYSQNSFPTSYSSMNLRSTTPQFQCYTPYSFHQPLSICTGQTTNNEMFHSLPPNRPPDFEEISQKLQDSNITAMESLKSPTNSQTSNASRSPTNIACPSAILKGSLRRKNNINGLVAKNSYEAYEDRMLPALRHPHLQANDIVRECQIVVEQTRKWKLNERERKQAALPISVFGMDLVEKFYSKHFADKEEGLRLLQEQLRQHLTGAEEEDNNNQPAQRHSPNKMARAAIFLMHRALRDKVYSVYSAAADAVRFFFTEFLPGRLSQAEVARSVEKLMPELISKSGDVTPRIHNMAAHTLLSMADCKEVRGLHIIPVQLSRPLSSGIHPRLALSRLEMVEQLILNHGISTEKQSGLTCRTLAEFGASGLHHPAEAVRKVSERILLHVYKVNPRLVRKQLPPDDDVTRRNLLYRHLFQEFDLMDTQKNAEKAREMELMKSSTLPTASKLKLRENKKFAKVAPEPLNVNRHEIIKTKSDHAIDRMVSQIPKRTVNQQTSPTKPFVQTEFTAKENENHSLITGGHKTLPTEKNEPLQSCTVNQSQIINLKMENGSKQRGMTRITEELPDSETEKEITAKEAVVHFPNLVDSVHVAESRTMKKSLKYIFPTTYIGNSITSQERVNKANSTLCKINPEFSLDKTHKLPMHFSGIPIPKNGFNGRKGGIFNSLLFANKFSSKFSSKGKQEKNSMEDLDLSKGDMTTAVYIPNTKREDQITTDAESLMNLVSTSEQVPPAQSITEKDGKLMKTCIFCFAIEDWFDEVSLNMHYWKNCPMLTRCQHCEEVVEIAGMIQHRLDDCEQKKLFRLCDLCKEAILKDDFDSHECKVSTSKNTRTRCLFCHEDVKTEEDWRNHLMGERLCPKHPRKTQDL